MWKKKIFFLGKEGKMKETKAKDQGRQEASVENVHFISGIKYSKAPLDLGQLRAHFFLRMERSTPVPEGPCPPICEGTSAKCCTLQLERHPGFPEG